MENIITESIPAASAVLYDGECNFCIYIVKLIKNIKNNNIDLFIPIQSREAKALLRFHKERFIDLNTIYFIYHNKIYKKSTAAFKIIALLPFPWKILSWFRIFPVSWTDRLYSFIACYRHKIIKKKQAI